MNAAIRCSLRRLFWRPLRRALPATALLAACAAPSVHAAYLLSQQVYDVVTAAAEHTDAGDYKAARDKLKRFAAHQSLNPYERAVIEQQLGAIASATDDYAAAAAHFEAAMKADGLPRTFLAQLRYNAAQVYLALERAEAAAALLEALFADGDEPPPAAYFSMAFARHLAGRDEEALDWAERGLRAHPAPAENHYALASGLNLQLERWARARELLAEMIRLFPTKAIYWRQLVAASLSMDDEEQALVASELGYRRGLLREGDDVLRLARLYLYHEFPHKAARLLARGMDDGVIEATTDNYELLASAWINAREHARAIAPLQKAAQRANDGELFLRLARLWVEDEDWPRAHKSLEQALERGGLDDEPGARLLNGIVLAKRNRTAEAKAEFNYCLGFQATKTEATRWLEYIAGRE